MKLIKLQSEQTLTEASFTNNIYSGGYTLPPKAQVCLKNLSLDFDQPIYTVVDSGENKNNNFSFQTSDSSIHNIELTAGEYNLRDLIIEIQCKINNALNTNVTTEKGFQWSIGKEIDARGNLNLIFAFSRADPITLNSATVQLTAMDYNAGSSYFYKTGSNTGTFNSHLSGNTLVCNGGFEVSTIIKNQNTADPSLSDWIFGIDSDKTSSAFPSKALIMADMKACISNNLGKYVFKIGGYLVPASPTISIAANDIIKIQKIDNKIVYSVTKGSTTQTVLGDTINNDSPLFLLGVSNLGYMIHIGDDNGKIAFNSLTMTPSPFSVASSGVYTIIPPQDVIDIYLDTNVSVTPSNVGFEFLNKKTGSLLGFLSTRYIINRLKGSITSDVGLTIDFLNDDLELEIVELANVNSYTQSTKQLRGIIGVIPISSLKNSTVVTGAGIYSLSYDETASWAMLSIDNNEPLRLSSVTVRALSNAKIVKLNGRMSCTLLFQSEIERN